MSSNSDCQDEINSRLRAIVEKLKANLPVAGLVDVVSGDVRSRCQGDNIQKIRATEWAGERKENTNLYRVVDELEKISGDPRNAIEHAESALRFWESAATE